MKNIDKTDIYVFILVIALASAPIAFSINYLIAESSNRKKEFEEHCVEYYLENNYVLSECEKFTDKLNGLEKK